MASFSAAALISCIIRSGLIAVPLLLTDLHMVQQEKKAVGTSIFPKDEA